MEWDGEGGNYSEVPRKWIIDVGADPSEGDAVRVQEGSSSKHTYGGIVIKKGMFMLKVLICVHINTCIHANMHDMTLHVTDHISIHHLWP